MMPSSRSLRSSAGPDYILQNLSGSVLQNSGLITRLRVPKHRNMAMMVHRHPITLAIQRPRQRGDELNWKVVTPGQLLPSL
jgi:hypothetical protein